MVIALIAAICCIVLSSFLGNIYLGCIVASLIGIYPFYEISKAH